MSDELISVPLDLVTLMADGKEYTWITKLDILERFRDILEQHRSSQAIDAVRNIDEEINAIKCHACGGHGWFYSGGWDGKPPVQEACPACAGHGTHANIDPAYIVVPRTLLSTALYSHGCYEFTREEHDAIAKLKDMLEST